MLQPLSCTAWVAVTNDSWIFAKLVQREVLRKALDRPARSQSALPLDVCRSVALVALVGPARRPRAARLQYDVHASRTVVNNCDLCKYPFFACHAVAATLLTITSSGRTFNM